MRIEVSTPIANSARVMQMRGMFDVPQSPSEGYAFEVPAAVQQIARGLPEREWNVGLIVGPSGSGKTTVAKELFGVDAACQWTTNTSVLDNFPSGMGVKDITGLLTSVGLGSPPSWLRPYHTLSNGEMFRADVARHLASPRRDWTVIDEFTSVVDRTVAQVSSHAVQKAVRRTGRKLIAVTCHFDLIDWLQPDWVYRPDTVDFEWRRLQRRPELDIEVTEVPRSAWPPFSRFHYLSHSLHVASHNYGMWLGDECIAFNCHIPFPHPSRKNIRMGHRLVVLPDYQGLGLGLVFDNWLGEYLTASGYRYHKTISHPALIAAYAKSPRWEALQSRNAPTRGGAKRLHKTMQNTRKLATRSFRYLPALRTSSNSSMTNSLIAG